MQPNTQIQLLLAALSPHTPNRLKATWTWRVIKINTTASWDFRCLHFWFSVECDCLKLLSWGKKFAWHTFFEEPYYLLLRLLPQKSRSLRRKSTRSSLAVQRRPPPRENSGKRAGLRTGFPCGAKTDECDSGSHPVCSSWSFCVLQQLQKNGGQTAPWLPLSTFHTNNGLALSLLYILYSFVNPFFFFAQCAKSYFSLGKSWMPKCSHNLDFKH